MKKGKDFDIEEIKRSQNETIRMMAENLWHSFVGQYIEVLIARGEDLSKEALLAEIRADIEGRDGSVTAPDVAKVVLRKVESITSSPLQHHP
jgi:hypothetical protein